MGGDFDHGGLREIAARAAIASLYYRQSGAHTMPTLPKARTLLIVLAAILLAAGAGLWLGRDLPRRWVEILLAEALGASVELESLTFEARDRFLLEGLTLGPSEALPPLAAAEIRRLRVRGDLRDFLAGDFEAVEVEGAVLHLRPRALLPPPEDPPRFRRVSLRKVEVWFEKEDGERTGPLRLEGTLREVGDPALAADLTFAGERLDLAPLAAVAALGTWQPSPALAGSLEGLAGSLRLSGGNLTADLDLARLEGHGGALEGVLLEGSSLEVALAGTTNWTELGIRNVQLLSPSGPQTLEDARLKASLVTLPGTGDEQDVSVTASLGGRPLGELHGSLRPEAGKPPRVTGLAGSFREVPLALLAPWLPPAGAWKAEGTLSLEIEPGRGPLVPVRLEVRAPRLQGSSPEGLSLDARDLEAEVSGALDLPRLGEGAVLELFPEPLTGRVRLPRLAGSLGGRPVPAELLPLEATFELTLPSSAGRREGLPLPHGDLELRAGRAGLWQVELPAGDPQGAVSLPWRWQGAALRNLLPLAGRLSFSLPPGLEADGDLRARGTLGWEGALPTAADLRGEGRLTFEEGWVRQRGGETAEGSGSWALTGARAEVGWRWRSGRLVAEIEGMEGSLSVEPLAPFPLRAEGRLETAPAAGTVAVRSLEVTVPELLDLTAEGDWTDGTVRGRLSFGGLGLSPWRERLRPLTGELAPGVTLSGTAHGELEGALSGAAWSLRGPVEIEGSGFASEDGSHVLEGLSSRWQVHAHSGGESSGLAARLQARAQVGGFQILLGTFFADFSGLQTELSLDAALTEPGEGEASGEVRTGVRWQLEDGASLTAGAVLPAAHGEGALRGSVHLVAEDLEGLLDRHLRAPLLDASDRFESLEARGGLRLRVEGSRSANGRLEVEGSMVADDLSLEGLGPARMEDLRLDLPFHLVQEPGEAWKPGSRRDGSLRFRGFEVGSLALEAAEAPVVVAGDTLSLRRPLVLPLAGGRIVLEDLSIVGLLTPSRHLETAVELNGLELERLTAALGTLPLEGRIDGRLPRIRLDGSSLAVDGGGEVQVFGGTVTVGDISGQDILSRYPKVVFSAEFRELDLGRITRRFDVGEMSGVLQGSLRSCELFQAVPVRCFGRFETVERPGVKRTISVKAVNNIAILGTGQSAGFLDRGITRFFDRYTYSRMGIEMSLDRDVFLLRGLEKRRGKELFLKGRLPFPIDVVNAQPGRTVSFQTMLRRLQALDFDKAVTER